MSFKPYRATHHLLWLTVIASAHPIGGQVPAAAPTQAVVIAIPKTPAGDALRAWLDAYNSGDSTQMAAYLRTYQPERAVGDALYFRRMSGGFDLLTIERSEPRHIEFTLRERSKPMTAYGALDLSAGEPTRVTDLMLEPLGLNASVAALRIDATTRARVVDRATALLDSFYVFPEAAKRMGDSVHARLARGVYDAYETGPGFAMRLNSDLGEIAHDKHLDVRYSTRALPPRPESATPPKPTPEEVAQERKEMDEINCGFRKVEQLEGNVGYLKFDEFADPEICEPTASAAMNFLAGTCALILDLRENGGGTPGMVAFVASYLFDRRTHLNDLWTRRTRNTEEFWTRDSVPGRRFGAEKPIYILTSAHTFSGAEEFAYDLKTLKRATIVGETTGGGAHPVRGRRIDDHFMIGVPFARAINPITHTNWEGVGVEPDVKVPARIALDTAQTLLRKTVRGRSPG